MYNFKKRLVSLTSAATLIATGFTIPGMQMCSYAQEAQKPVVTSKQKAAGWTYGIYMCGNDLEQYTHSASSDLIEILKAKVPKGFSKDNNFIVQTGGCLQWHFKERYEKYLMKQGFSEDEIQQIVPEEINSEAISLFKINFEHEYKADDGKTKTIAALEFIKEVGKYPSIPDEESEEEIIDKTGVEKEVETESDDLGANMGDEKYLKQFVNELDTNYPANHMALTLWNHGGGITGGACYDQYYDDPITLGELKNVLAERTKNGYEKLDMIGYDACLMSGYESWVNLAPYAKVGVGSLTSEPDMGWYYTPFVEELGEKYKDKSYDAKELGSSIVDAYEDYYKKDGLFFKDILERQKEEDEMYENEEEKSKKNKKYKLKDEYDSDEEYVAAYSMLSAIDLEKLALSSMEFAKLGNNLLNSYRDSEGITKIFTDASVNGNAELGAEVVGINSFLDATETVAKERIPVYEESEKTYDKLIADSYSKCLEVIPNIREAIDVSVINSCNGWEGNSLENAGCMSIFCPDKYARDDVAYFNYESYSLYSVSPEYAKLVYLYGGTVLREADRVIDVDPILQYNAEDGTVSASIEHAGEDAFSIEGVVFQRFLEKDGKKYVITGDEAIPFFEGFSITGKPDNVYYTVGDSEPLYTSVSEEDGYTFAEVSGRLNGLYGCFYFSDEGTPGKMHYLGYISMEDLVNPLGSNNDEEEKRKSVSKRTTVIGLKEYFDMSKEAGEVVTEISSDDSIVLSTATVDEIKFYPMHGTAYKVEEKNEIKIKSVDDFILDVNHANDNDVYFTIGTYTTSYDYTILDENGLPKEIDYIKALFFNYGKFKDFINCNLTLDKKEYELTGEYIKPAITFENSKSNLVEGEDYEVIYENNLGLGKAKAIVRGLGSYAYLPEKTIEFDIVKVKNADGKIVYKTVVVKAPKQAKIKSVKNKKKSSLTVKWKKVKGANGYQIKYARNKKFTKGKKVKDIKSGKKTSAVLKNLKKNKTYFVKVRAYKLDVNGKKVYGDWSKVKKIKIQK